MRNPYPVASREAVDALCVWLLERRVGAKPDPQLLCVGLPQGPLLRATVRSDGAIDFLVADQRGPDHPRSPRGTDEDTFAAICWLCIPGAHLLFSRTDVEPDRPKQLHYLTYADHIKIHRIIADPKPGERVEFIGDYRNVRRSNLCKVPAIPGPTQNRPHKGRQLAIATAVTKFRHGDMSHLPINDAEDYEKMLRAAFSFVDEIPLGKMPE